MAPESTDGFEAMKAKGEALSQSGRIKEAMELYLEAGRRFSRQDAHPLAVAACKRVLQIDPLCTKAHLMLVDAYGAMGQTQESLHHLREVESFVRRSSDEGAVRDIQQRLRAANPSTLEAMVPC